MQKSMSLPSVPLLRFLEVGVVQNESRTLGLKLYYDITIPYATRTLFSTHIQCIPSLYFTLLRPFYLKGSTSSILGNVCEENDTLSLRGKQFFTPDTRERNLDLSRYPYRFTMTLCRFRIFNWVEGLLDSSTKRILGRNTTLFRGQCTSPVFTR